MEYSNYGKKKTWKEKFNAGAKKVAGACILASAAGGVGYYHYGTIKEQDVKILDYSYTMTDGKAASSSSGPDFDDSYFLWSVAPPKNESALAANYTFVTDKGKFVAEPSMAHFQSQDDANKIWADALKGHTYHIKSYGVHIFGKTFQPNIIELREVTPDELKAIEKMKEARVADVNQQLKKDAPVAQQSAATGGTQAQPFSGALSSYTFITEGGYVIKMTGPAEVAGKLIINSVEQLPKSTNPAFTTVPKPPTPKFN